MRFVRNFASLLALLATISLTTLSVGCGDASKKGLDVKDGSGPKSAANAAPEAGSTTGGGTAVPAGH